jgi:hypothetical protein
MVQTTAYSVFEPWQADRAAYHVQRTRLHRPRPLKA